MNLFPRRPIGPARSVVVLSRSPSGSESWRGPQYFTTRDESLIAYEASNHYYYTPVDLLEKILNCEQVIAELRTGAPIGEYSGAPRDHVTRLAGAYFSRTRNTYAAMPSIRKNQMACIGAS